MQRGEGGEGGGVLFGRSHEKELEKEYSQE